MIRDVLSIQTRKWSFRKKNEFKSVKSFPNETESNNNYYYYYFRSIPPPPARLRLKQSLCKNIHTKKKNLQPNLVKRKFFKHYFLFLTFHKGKKEKRERERE